eukprot:9083758-Lingulodinium_polyedra.AAC.1
MCIRDRSSGPPMRARCWSWRTALGPIRAARGPLASRAARALRALRTLRAMHTFHALRKLCFRVRLMFYKGVALPPPEGAYLFASEAGSRESRRM